MSNESTWCVHIQGPDEVLPAAGRLDAMLKANTINANSVEIIAAHNDGLHPSVWAVPVLRSDLYAPKAV